MDTVSVLILRSKSNSTESDSRWLLCNVQRFTKIWYECLTWLVGTGYSFSLNNNKIGGVWNRLIFSAFQGLYYSWSHGAHAGFIRTAILLSGPKQIQALESCVSYVVRRRHVSCHSWIISIFPTDLDSAIGGRDLGCRNCDWCSKSSSKFKHPIYGWIFFPITI